MTPSLSQEGQSRSRNIADGIMNPQWLDSDSMKTLGRKRWEIIHRTFTVRLFLKFYFFCNFPNTAAMCVKLCRLNRICWWRGRSHKHCTGKWEDHDCRRWKPNTSSKMRGFSIVKFVFGLAVEYHCICHSLLPSHPDEQILALVVRARCISKQYEARSSQTRCH